MAHADTRSLPRLRSRPISLRTFQRTAVATLVLLWLVVTTGGLVRLTASGLGCPHWPTCTTSGVVPQDSAHALIEFSNRAISGLAMLAAVATAVMAYRVSGLDRRIAHALAIAAAGTVAQVPLGAVTVEFDLNPYLVMSHFLLAMAVVSVSTWATVRALRPDHPVTAPAERRLGLLAWAAVAAYLALITSGAFVTAAGPHPGSTSTPIERVGNFYDAAWLHVRVATAFTLLFAAVAVWLWRRSRSSGAQRLSLAGIVLLGCQAAVGEYQYRNGLPWAVIAVHVALAATLLITVVLVASLVWEGDRRPQPAVGPSAGAGERAPA
jgi:cytochrome c oxidase assembly protein subunit 15